MPQTFDCPKCGAPVAFERSVDPSNLLVAIPLMVLVVIGLAAFGILAPAFYSVSRTLSNSNKPVMAKPNAPKKENVKIAREGV